MSGTTVIITSPPDDGDGRIASPATTHVKVGYSPPAGTSPQAMAQEIGRIQRLADEISGVGK